MDEGQKLFEPDVSKSGRGKILCVDDVIIFPFVDSQGNSAGYKVMSTNGEVKFTLKESFNEVCIFLPEYHSKISNFSENLDELQKYKVHRIMKFLGGCPPIKLTKIIADTI